MYTGKFLKQLIIENGKSVTRSAEAMGEGPEILNKVFLLKEIEDAAMIDFCTKIGLPFPAPYNIIHLLFSLTDKLYESHKIVEVLCEKFGEKESEILKKENEKFKSVILSKVDEIKSELKKIKMSMPPEFENIFN